MRLNSLSRRPQTQTLPKTSLYSLETAWACLQLPQQESSRANRSNKIFSQCPLQGQTELKILHLDSFKWVDVSSFQAKKESESMTGLADFDGNSVKLSWENFPDVGLSMVSEFYKDDLQLKSTFYLSDLQLRLHGAGQCVHRLRHVLGGEDHGLHHGLWQHHRVHEAGDRGECHQTLNHPGLGAGNIPWALKNIKYNGLKNDFGVCVLWL